MDGGTNFFFFHFVLLLKVYGAFDIKNGPVDPSCMQLQCFLL